MIGYWIFTGLLILQTIILLDYIVKALYIRYWESLYKNRFELLFDNIGKKSVVIRRRSIDGHYIIRYQSYINTGDRPYEFIGDGKGNIIIHGAKLRKVRPLLYREEINAPINVKLSKDNKKLKEKYVHLINSYIPPGSKPNCCSIMGPFPYLPKKPENIKQLKINGLSVVSDKSTIPPDEPRKFLPLPKQDEKSIENNIRKVALVVFNRRKVTEPDLYEIMNLSNYIRDIIEIYRKNKRVSDKDMDKYITDKIYKYAYENRKSLI